MDFELLKPQINQNQKFNMTYLMHSLSILQMTNLELREFIYSEVEKNPIIDIKIEKTNYSFSQKDTSKFHSIKYKPSLFEHLLCQAKEVFHTKKELFIAENIIGNLDNTGYFTLDINIFAKELKMNKNLIIKILKKIKTFDPKGIATKNLQDRILTYIENRKSLEYIAFKKYFELILKNKIHLLAKKLNISTKISNNLIEKVLKKVAFDPTCYFSSNTSFDISPDIIIKKNKNKWIIEIEENLPYLQINKSYINLLENKKIGSSKKFLFLAKILMKNILIRRKTLQNIVSYVIQKQRLFILGKGKLNPLTLKELAIALKVHPSTISRAISNKYIQCPIGFLPLKIFFHNTHKKKEPLKFIENTLKEIISNENKQKPFSDIELTKKLKQKGFDIHRRTLCKYRKKLHIGSVYQRKKYE